MKDKNMIYWDIHFKNSTGSDEWAMLPATWTIKELKEDWESHGEKERMGCKILEIDLTK